MRGACLCWLAHPVPSKKMSLYTSPSGRTSSMLLKCKVPENPRASDEFPIVENKRDVSVVDVKNTGLSFDMCVSS